MVVSTSMLSSITNKQLFTSGPQILTLIIPNQIAFIPNFPVFLPSSPMLPHVNLSLLKLIIISPLQFRPWINQMKPKNSQLALGPKKLLGDSHFIHDFTCTHAILSRKSNSTFHRPPPNSVSLTISST